MSASDDNISRIGIDVTPAVTQGGGIGRYTRELVRALVKTPGKIDRDYVLFSAKQPKDLPVPDPVPSGENITYRQAPLNHKWLYRLWYRFKVPAPVQLFTGQLDLFYSPDFVLPPVRDDIPTLLTVHDLSFVHFPEAFTPALVRYLNQVVPSSISRSSHVLADSQATKDDLVDIWSVPPHKITVLYSGVSQAFRPVTGKDHINNVRKKYGLGDWPYVMSVGTLQPRKNYEMLIKAFQPVAEKSALCLLIAGGKGWMFERMLAEVEAQGLGDRVFFLGFVDDDDLPALYSEATLFLFASLYEGFGLPLLEAMACGVPVMTSNASSLPEVAGSAAVQLPPDNPNLWTSTMLDLLEDASWRTELVASGFRQVRQFTWSKSAQQLLSIIDRMLDN
jgi:glycosyltransferase involved in cell wall biosynthesis